MKITRITAMWCTSCLVMKGRWEKIFKNHPEIAITDYDFDEDEAIIRDLNVGKTLPVLIVYLGGVEKTRIIGEKTKKQLSQIIGDLLNETD